MPKKNPFSVKKSNDATGFLLWQVHNYWQREIKKCLIDLDLTHTQFVILAGSYWLFLHQDLVTQTQVAKHSNTDVMMTSNILRTLEKKKFVIRKEHQTDTRAKTVELTETGIDVLTRAVKKVETFDRDFFGKLENITNFNAELLQLLDK